MATTATTNKNTWRKKRENARQDANLGDVDARIGRRPGRRAAARLTSERAGGADPVSRARRRPGRSAVASQPVVESSVTSTGGGAFTEAQRRAGVNARNRPNRI